MDQISAYPTAPVVLSLVDVDQVLRASASAPRKASPTMAGIAGWTWPSG